MSQQKKNNAIKCFNRKKIMQLNVQTEKTNNAIKCLNRKTNNAIKCPNRKKQTMQLNV